MPLLAGTNQLRATSTNTPCGIFDFNVFKDKTSAVEVLKSGLPITLIPCDQARKLRFSAAQVSQFSGPTGQFIYQNSKRWFRRAQILKLQKSIPVWDLTAALYLLKPDEFQFKNAEFNLSPFNYVQIKTSSNNTTLQTLSSYNLDVRNYAMKLLI